MAKYIRRSDGRYCTHVDIGYDEYGNRIRKTIYAKSERELDRQVSELKLKLAQGKISRDHQTVESYCDNWIKIYKQNKSLKTIKMYEYAINHIKSSIGNIEVHDLRTSDIQEMINEHLDAPRTCEQILLTMRQIVSRAIDDDILIKDVTRNVELPKKHTKEKRALLLWEVDAVFNAPLSDDDRAFLYCLYYFGLRKEEAYALMITDFDFKHKILTVNKALQIGSNRAETMIKDTKNSTSVRDIPMPEDAVSFLKAYCQQNKRKMYLFLDKNNNFATVSVARRTWERIIKAFNEYGSKLNPKKQVDGLTAHIFRHNFATLLYHSDIGIKEAANLMGHADTKMIMEVYAHLDKNNKKTTEKINSMFKKAGSQMVVK